MTTGTLTKRQVERVETAADGVLVALATLASELTDIGFHHVNRQVTGYSDSIQDIAFRIKRQYLRDNATEQ